MSITFLNIGMAGTGKSTFSARLNLWLSAKNKIEINQDTGLNKNVTLINLDPAILKTKMPLDIDIREYFDIEQVMKDYNLGPNGSVTTILNLFMLQWNGKIDGKYCVIDTPGQIEAFVWSNSGKVLVQKMIEKNNYYQIKESFEEIDTLKSQNELQKDLENES
ncbi:GTPase XAB1, interacts with DNA repair protein XPA, partial [Pseudoloma neurophilia]